MRGAYMPMCYQSVAPGKTPSMRKAKHKWEINGTSLLPNPALPKQASMRTIACVVLLLGFVVPASADKVTIKEPSPTTNQHEIKVQLNRNWRDDKCPIGSTPVRAASASLIDLNSGDTPTSLQGTISGGGALKTITTWETLSARHTYLVYLTQ